MDDGRAVEPRLLRRDAEDATTDKAILTFILNTDWSLQADDSVFEIDFSASDSNRAALSFANYFAFVIDYRLQFACVSAEPLGPIQLKESGSIVIDFLPFG